jgi:predicted ATPase
MVGIVGEPGVGKSRLVLELRRAISSRPAVFLEGRCLSYGRSIPYLPVLDLLRADCGILETDASALSEPELRRRFESSDPWREANRGAPGPD